MVEPVQQHQDPTDSSSSTADLKNSEQKDKKVKVKLDLVKELKRGCLLT